MNASQTAERRMPHKLRSFPAALLAACAGAALLAPIASAQQHPTAVQLSAGSLALDEPTTSPPGEPSPTISESAASSSTPAHLDADRPTPWTVRILPKLWFAAPSGKLRMPLATGAPATNDTGKARVNDLDFDRTRLRPAGDVRIEAGDWYFAFSGAQYEISRDSVTADTDFRLAGLNIASGDAFALNFELGLYELNAGYCVWAKDFQADSKNPSDALPIVLKLYLLGGVRFYDMTVDFRTLGAGGRSSNFDNLFTEPLIGARLDAAFTSQFGVEVQTSVGYLPGNNDTSFSVDVVAEFYWRPLPNFGVLLGYRQLAFDVESGEDAGKFEYDGRLAGLFTGVEIRF